VFVESELELLLDDPWCRVTLVVEWNGDSLARALDHDVYDRRSCRLFTNTQLEGQELVITESLVTKVTG